MRRRLRRTRSTGLGEPRATAQSTPSTMPVAMLATDIHIVLTRPKRILGQNEIFARRRPVDVADGEGPDQESGEGQDDDDREDPAIVARTDVTKPSNVDFLGE